jgi:hypothetical protein
MIRQAQTYMVGAMSGATLIAIAIAVFVMLVVSAQVFHSWPIAALGDSGSGKVEVSDARAAESAKSAATATAAAANRTATPARAGSKRGRHDAGRAPGTNEAAAADPVETPGTQPSSPGESGNQPSSSNPTGPSSSAPAAGGNQSSGSSSSSGNSGSSSSGGSGSRPPSTSQTVTETVNSTVNTVDEAALGGTLKNTGVSGVTEEVVNGVAGPESAVGKVVDETVKTVGGLLGGNR